VWQRLWSKHNAELDKQARESAEYAPYSVSYTSTIRHDNGRNRGDLTPRLNQREAWQLFGIVVEILCNRGCQRAQMAEILRLEKTTGRRDAIRESVTCRLMLTTATNRGSTTTRASWWVKANLTKSATQPQTYSTNYYENK
jgi:hypothetical protein